MPLLYGNPPFIQNHFIHCYISDKVIIITFLIINWIDTKIIMRVFPHDAAFCSADKIYHNIFEYFKKIAVTIIYEHS